jgi:hypothetical protein
MKKSNILKLILAGAGIAGAGFGIAKNKDKILDRIAEDKKEYDPLDGLTDREREVVNAVWSLIPLDEVEDYVTIEWLKNILVDTQLLPELTDECAAVDLEDTDRLIDTLCSVMFRHLRSATSEEKMEVILSIFTELYCEESKDNTYYDTYYPEDEEDINDEMEEYYEDTDY